MISCFVLANLGDGVHRLRSRCIRDALPLRKLSPTKTGRRCELKLMQFDRPVSYQNYPPLPSALHIVVGFKDEEKLRDTWTGVSLHHPQTRPKKAERARKLAVREHSPLSSVSLVCLSTVTASSQPTRLLLPDRQLGVERLPHPG